MFNWALVGLARLRGQGGFTEAATMKDAVAGYRLDSNPAKQFLIDYTTRDGETLLKASHLFEQYKKWAASGGFRPLAKNSFGKEVHRLYRGIEKVRRGGRGQQMACYAGVDYRDGAVSAEDATGAYPENF